MSQTDTKFVGQIPEIYDTYMVPLVFQAYADEMAGRVAALSPQAVLETAAGSGVVTRALAPMLAADARYVVTDLNGPMLERAQLRQGPDGRIEWSVADAQKLNHPDGIFDCVCCQFGAMFFPDRTGAYAEARRVLKPGAPFIFSVWDSLAHNDLTRTVWDAVTAHYPENPPQFFHRKPHGYFDKAVIRQDLEAAGFAGISIDIVARESRAKSARDVAVALVQGTPLRMELAVRDPDGLATVTDVAEAAVLRAYGAAEVAGKIQALVIEARG